MARKKVPITEKKMSRSASVSSALDAVILAVAAENQWSPSKAAGSLLDMAAKQQGLYRRYRKQIELALSEKQAA